MSFGYVIRPRADRDIDEIIDYLAQAAGIDSALRFLAETHTTFELLATHPQMGWRCKLQNSSLANARTFPVSARFEKYMIFYQPAPPGPIEIVRVLHGSQDLEVLFDREPA